MWPARHPLSIAPADVPKLLPAVVTNICRLPFWERADGLDLMTQSSTSTAARSTSTEPSRSRRSPLWAPMPFSLTSQMPCGTNPCPTSIRPSRSGSRQRRARAPGILKRLVSRGNRSPLGQKRALDRHRVPTRRPDARLRAVPRRGCRKCPLATGSMLFAVAAETRRRAVEAVALRSVGLPWRNLVTATAGELGDRLRDRSSRRHGGRSGSRPFLSLLGARVHRALSRTNALPMPSRSPGSPCSWAAQR